MTFTLRPRVIVVCAAFVALGPAGPPGAWAGRFIAVPFAETIARGRYSLWQFGIYEERGPRTWRSLNRLDLGPAEGVELGALIVSPQDKPSDTWLNIQVRPLNEGAYVPAVSAGVWDLFRKGAWFESLPAGPSPFVAAGKGLKRGKIHAKGGLSYGFNRLHGLSGGLDVRFLPGTGATAEHAPRNLRLPGADAWDVGVYQWLGEHWRVRASWMGGNPMADVFFTWSFIPQP